MFLSIWRLSHLSLATLSALFLIVLSISGIVLSFSPIKNQISKYRSDELEKITLSSLINNINKNQKEILEIKIDRNDFVEVKAISKKGEMINFYANAKNGEAKGEVEKESRFFKLFRNIHRSLLLKKTGRIIIGIISFILFLLSFSGSILIIKRQLSIRKFYSKVIFDDFYQFWHIINGRMSLVFIVIISLTGVFLSLERFEIINQKKDLIHNIDYEKIEDFSKKTISDFEIFKKIKVSELDFIQFPFSSFVEDQFTVRLKDKELIINQFNGEVISSVDFDFVKKLSRINYNLHTGEGSIIWSVILLISCFSILFFIFSGFKITLKRIQFKSKNSFKEKESEFLILVGSENGNTNRYAKYLQEIISSNNKKVFIDQLDNYKPIENLQQIIILTSTYGLGQPPSNAKKFIKKFQKKPLKKTFNYSIVGFGSRSYPDFCQFAIDVNGLLEKYENGNSILPIKLINNQNQTEFNKWVDDWGAINNFIIQGYQENLKLDFEVIKKTKSQKDPNNNFTIRLRPLKKNVFQSGDLIAFQIGENQNERYYSIAKDFNDNIFLSIKRHLKGECSQYLDDLKVKAIIKAKIIKNDNFHAPEDCDNLILIGNGTGIAPLLGMAYENHSKKKIDIYWGSKFKKSLNLYSDIVNELIDEERLSSFNDGYSREEKLDKLYVQDLIELKKEEIIENLTNKTQIMICGSTEMGKDVVKKIKEILKDLDGFTFENLEQNNQINVDTY